MIRSVLPVSRLNGSGLPVARVIVRKAGGVSEYEPLTDIDGETLTDADDEVIRCLKYKV